MGALKGATLEYGKGVDVKVRGRIGPRESTGGTHIARQYDDYAEFIELVSMRERVERKDASSDAQGRGESWDLGVESVGEWCAMAVGDGYAAAVGEVETLASGLRNEVLADVMGVQWETFRDVAGSAVDVAAFCSGEPECMLETFPMPVPAKGRAIRLYMPVGAAGGVKAETMVRRGAAVVALADLCAAYGRPVEVWVGFEYMGGAGDRDARTTAVRVQRADMPLDVARVALALCHPATLRRAGFGLAELEEEAMRRAFNNRRSDGMGRPLYGEGCGLDSRWISEDASTLPVFLEDIEGVTLRVGGALSRDSDYRFGSDANARAWIAEQLREAEVIA